jgi:hypothetical protein
MPSSSSLFRPRNVLATIAAMLVLAGCQTSPPTHPVPSVQQIGSDLKCKTGDHGFEDLQAAWGFCYPGTWHYNERSQASQNPPGLDLTFDITDIPCTSPPPGSRPVCSPEAGRFAYMIIGTYERGGAADLTAWEKTYLPGVSTSQTIRWGNAVEAAKLADGRRIALTQHHVVILDMRSANALLDLEGQMSSRLDTWMFTY